MAKSGLKKVIVLGSGALKIGQAGEFDYSGSQALKALKEEGILYSIAEPQTSQQFRHPKVLPTRFTFCLSPTYFVEEVIKKEQPDGISAWLSGDKRP